MSSVMMGMRQCGAIGIKFKGQRLVVMMTLARVVHQGVLDLERQAAALSRHEGKGWLQLQRDQDQGEPTTEHGVILAMTAGSERSHGHAQQLRIARQAALDAA